MDAGFYVTMSVLGGIIWILAMCIVAGAMSDTYEWTSGPMRSRTVRVLVIVLAPLTLVGFIVFGILIAIAAAVFIPVDGLITAVTGKSGDTGGY